MRRSQIASLITKKLFIIVFAQYTDFINIFFLNLVSKLGKHITINSYVIELLNSQQLSYKPIYSLGIMKLKTLKAYIKTNLAKGFIGLFKLSIGASIIFN